MTRLLAVAVVVVLMAPLAEAQPTARPKPTGEEAAVYALHEQFSERWNRHDIPALASVWAEDGDYIEPDGSAVFGRGEVQRRFGFEHGSVFKDTHLSLVVERVRFLADGVALADGTYELFGARDPHGRPIGTRSGYLTSVAVKDGDAWKVSAVRLMLPQVLIWRETK